MSGSETSLIEELPNPHSITAAVSSALSLGPGLEDGARVQMTAIDEATHCRRLSVSTLKIGDISLQDRSPHPSISWNQRKSSSTFKQEMITNDDDVCQYFTNCYVGEESEDSLADFPSPGKLRKTTGGNGRKRSRSPVRNKSLGSPTPFSYSFNAGHCWRVTLDDADLWREFSSIGTEMVITKTGRRMFPSLSVSVRGLDHNKQYSITLDIQPADQSRHKFIGDSWQAVGKAEKEFVRCEFIHTDSPNLGSHWMKKPVSFKFVKLTNNRNNKSADQIILNSMHKYLPRICIVEESMHSSVMGELPSRVFCFHETAFIAVTAYQNERITQLKIDNNPYARAFRETIPSEMPQQPPRVGGHAKRIKSVASVVDRYISCSSSPSLTPPIVNRTTSSPKSTCNSLTSIESGFESDSDGAISSRDKESPDLRPSKCYVRSRPATEERAVKKRPDLSLVTLEEGHQSGSSSTLYWADEYHSLYEQDLLAPTLALDPASSFSEPYLRACSYSLHHSEQFYTSPLKPLGAIPSTLLDDEVFYN